MESRIKIQFTYNGKNIKKNLFSKPYPNTELKHLSSDENQHSENLLIPRKLNSCVYCRKIPKMENKNIQKFINKPKKLFIDSLSEVRLPPDFIDLSYDHQKIE